MVILSGWSDLALTAVNYLIAFALIIFFAVVAMQVVRILVPEKNFLALTTCVAAIGAIAAVSQIRTAADQQLATSTRLLAFALAADDEMMGRLSSVPASKSPGGVAEAAIMPPSLIAERIPQMREIRDAVLAIDPKDLLSSRSMIAFLQEKAGIRRMVDDASAALVANRPVDFSSAISWLLTSQQTLRQERFALAPVYRLGSIFVSTGRLLP